MSRIEKITDRILVLSDVETIDGRVSWLTPRAEGYEPYNEHLLLSDTHALLIETGVAAHGPSLVGTLKECLDLGFLPSFRRGSSSTASAISPGFWKKFPVQ
jgi:hypothetical protein